MNLFKKLFTNSNMLIKSHTKDDKDHVKTITICKEGITITLTKDDLVELVMYHDYLELFSNKPDYLCKNKK